MGSFYANVVVPRCDRERVADILRALRREAFLAATPSGATVIYDEACESLDDEEIAELGSALSKRTFGFVWAVVCADDDALAYQLFRAGKVADKYEAGSDFEVQGGNAQALAEAFGCPERVPALDAVLRRPGLGDGSYTFASERHSDLAVALGLPADWVCLGYTYLSEGDLPEGLAATDLLHVSP
jgi:hypothetical protein